MRRNRWFIGAAFMVACSSNDGDNAAETSSTAATSDDPATSANPTESTGGETTDPLPGSTGESSASSSDNGEDPTIGDSSTGTPMVPEGCFDYYAFEPSDVSFRNDLMPIFVESCWMCHSDLVEGIFLGYGGTTENEAMLVRNSLLTVTPLQAPAMEFVVIGDPLTSWFMAKLEYEDPSSDCPLIECPNPGCDWFAPPTERLPEAQLAMIRSWILNGALDN